MRLSRKLAVVGLAGGGACASTAALAQYGVYTPNIVPQQIAAYFISGILGMSLGLLFSEQAAPFRRYLWYALVAVVFFASFSAPYPINGGLTYLVVVLLFFAALGAGLACGRNPRGGYDRSVTFGSARWATLEHVRERRYLGSEGLVLGYFPPPKLSDAPLPLHYTGDRHLLTVAPTRAGKGVAAIIPNLLSYRGSVLCVDPKGENAMISSLRRGQGDAARGIEGLGQAVHVVDPWGLTTAVTSLPPACFNPLDWLDPADPEIGENAMMLADALIVTPGGSADPYWSEEAKAVIMGFILHVVTSPAEAGSRHLGRVRDLLMLNPDQFDELLEAMFNSSNEIVQKSAARLAGKEAKLRSGVISSAQAQTHFLDSPILRANLSRSDFRFEDLKAIPTTVYLVLPADRLDAFGRWLRLLIQQAITVTARNIAVRPERPILFMLDEMAALGRLTMVEQAYGLMAGFGMQLWGIVQDLSQLHRVYGDGWQTFIGNSGVLQYFGSRDKMTAEYFSDLCGVTTVNTLSSSISRAFSSGPQGGSSSITNSTNHGETQRKLIMPDELMRVASGVQLVLAENLDPIAGWKSNWFSDARFRGLGVNLRNLPSPAAGEPEPTGSAPGTDLRTAA